jgi:hypothetical protein
MMIASKTKSQIFLFMSKLQESRPCLPIIRGTHPQGVAESSKEIIPISRVFSVAREGIDPLWLL